MAQREGIALRAISSFRNFESQKRIWNLKASGKREVLDSQSRPLEFSQLEEKDLVHAILRWSALPGFSRHHWGTEFDLIDENILHENPYYKVKLIPSEYQRGGIFEKLGLWLDKEIHSFPFFTRPFQRDRGGTAPEPWHLSYTPVASSFFAQLESVEIPSAFIQSSLCDDILLISWIRENFPLILRRYILNK